MLLIIINGEMYKRSFRFFSLIIALTCEVGGAIGSGDVKERVEAGAGGGCVVVNGRRRGGRRNDGCGSVVQRLTELRRREPRLEGVRVRRRHRLTLSLVAVRLEVTAAAAAAGGSAGT